MIFAACFDVSIDCPVAVQMAISEVLGRSVLKKDAQAVVVDLNAFLASRSGSFDSFVKAVG